MTAREAALSVLKRCRREGAWSGAAVDSMIRKNSLDRRDASLVSALCLGVLQNRSYFDFLIDSFCTTKSAKIEPGLRDILHLGLCQLLLLDRIPPRAAVNETVLLCRSAGMQRASGLVNAVLRRVSENRDRLPEVPGKGRASYLSTRYSQPLWLAEQLTEQEGYAFTEAFFSFNNEASGLTVQINTQKTDVSAFLRLLEERQISYTSASFPSGSVDIRGGSISELPGYEEGLFYVQDRSARIAAELTGSEPGMRLLDVCAAPGGKSFACAIRMKNEGEIISCDIHEKKLSLIRSGAERLGLSIIKPMARDARLPMEEWNGRFDIVIADVPCSGFGVMAGKPEIRFKTREEIAGLPAIQLDILRCAASFVKPGGTLLYSTCTVLREENEGVVTAFLAENRKYSVVPFSLPGGDCPEGMHTFWPHIDGGDGFFAAKLQRTEQ